MSRLPRRDSGGRTRHAAGAADAQTTPKCLLDVAGVRSCTTSCG